MEGGLGIWSRPARCADGGVFESLIFCEGTIWVLRLSRSFTDAFRSVTHGPRRILRQKEGMELYLLGVGCCSFLRDATASLRSSSGGEVVDSEVVDICLSLSYQITSDQLLSFCRMTNASGSNSRPLSRYWLATRHLNVPSTCRVRIHKFLVVHEH